MAYYVAKTRKAQPRKVVTTAGLITFDQFFDIVEEKVKADLLDGKIIRDSPAIPRHGFTATWIGNAISYYAEKLDLGIVGGATMTVRLTKYQGPEPDVFFIHKSRFKIIVEKYIDGPPDLCVEVISKSSSKRDRGRKFVLYAEHGVKEYWIIDPRRITIEFYENQEGEWAEIKPDVQGRLHSKILPGFWLQPEWFAAFPPLPVYKLVDEMIAEKQRSIQSGA